MAPGVLSASEPGARSALVRQLALLTKDDAMTFSFMASGDPLARDFCAAHDA